MNKYSYNRRYQRNNTLFFYQTRGTMFNLSHLFACIECYNTKQITAKAPVVTEQAAFFVSERTNQYHPFKYILTSVNHNPYEWKAVNLQLSSSKERALWMRECRASCKVIAVLCTLKATLCTNECVRMRGAFMEKYSKFDSHWIRVKVEAHIFSFYLPKETV